MFEYVRWGMGAAGWGADLEWHNSTGWGWGGGGGGGGGGGLYIASMSVIMI